MYHNLFRLIIKHYIINYVKLELYRKYNNYVKLGTLTLGRELEL